MKLNNQFTKYVDKYFTLVMIMLGLYAITGAVQLPMRLINDGTGLLNDVFWVVIYFAAFIVAIVIAGSVYLRYGHFSLKQKLTKKDVETAIACYAVAIVVEMILGSVQLKLYHQASSRNNDVILNTLAQNRIVLVCMTISMVCLTPILEELVFRGFLMDGFFSVRHFWWPIVISGIVFASGHLVSNLVSFGIYAFLGGCLAFAYRKTGNIRTSILMHAFNNLISVIPLLITILH